MKNKIYCFELVSVDMSNLGGPMGNNSTSENWRKLFTTMQKAKTYAENDYYKTGRTEKIKWSKSNKITHTQDLGFVMYEIDKKEMQ